MTVNRPIRQKDSGNKTTTEGQWKERTTENSGNKEQQRRVETDNNRQKDSGNRQQHTEGQWKQTTTHRRTVETDNKLKNNGNKQQLKDSEDKQNLKDSGNKQQKDMWKQTRTGQ